MSEITDAEVARIAAEISASKLYPLQATFAQEGHGNALKAAEAILKAEGFSVGSGCAGQPTGVMFGDYLIAKWRNLSPVEKCDCHAVMRGDRRNGPLTITWQDAFVQGGSAAFLRVMARQRLLEAHS